MNRGRTSLDLAPFLEMPYDNLLCLCTDACLLYPPNVKRAILSRERANAAHIVAIVGKLISRKAVFRRIGKRVCRVWKEVPVLALPTIRTASPGEEEAAVFHPGHVRPREACVAFDRAAGLGFCFADEAGEQASIVYEKGTYFE